MIVGVPKEIKNREHRVALTPSGSHALVQAGHRVLVEREAGAGSGFSDDSYSSVGAELVPEAEALWKQAELILKVKEPLPEEYRFFREGLTVFAFLHLASNPELARELSRRNMTAIAYETVQLDDATLPLLLPMSMVAGRMAVQIGAHLLEKTQGGRGVLLGGIPGVSPGRVAVIGGGAVGSSAAELAAGLRARVTVLDNNPVRLKQLDERFRGRIETLMSNPLNIEKTVAEADLVIGAVLIPGGRTPRLVTEDMVKRMRPGSAIVDVSVDQGGCVETVDRVTTHDRPTYVKHGVVHYAVPNIPAAVPHTSTVALTNATLPYILRLANRGVDRAVAGDPSLAKGVMIRDGRIVHEAVAQAVSDSN